MKKHLVKSFLTTAILGCACLSSVALAKTGRLLVTGGATTIEGSAGGGVVPLAFIAGLGARGETGYTGFASYANLDDYTLRAGGFAIGFDDRFEFSYSRISLDFSDSKVNGFPGDALDLDTFGFKWKLGGDAMYAPNEALPQISIGLQYKHNQDKKIMNTLQVDNHGIDVYVAATKVYFAGLAGRNVLLNGVLRGTKANNIGLLGFGGNRNDKYKLVAEASAAILLTPKLVLGAEYKMKPHDNINIGLDIEEDDWKDIFIGYFPSKNVSIVAAYTDLGQIALDKKQSGFYLSLQATF